MSNDIIVSPNVQNVIISPNTVDVIISTIGIQGPPGPTGVVVATAPITYNSGSQTVALSYGSSLTTSSNNLIVDSAVVPYLSDSNTFTADQNINGLTVGKGAGSQTIYNTAFGLNSLILNNTGSDNTAIGAQTLYFNTSGYNNSAFGASVLSSNSTGNNNTGVGMYNLLHNSTASGNTAVGSAALELTTTGGNNTALGLYAGFSNVTGTGNVFLGNNAGYSETGSNKLYISNSNTSTPLIKGDFSANTVTINGTLTTTIDGGSA